MLAISAGWAGSAHGAVAHGGVQVCIGPRADADTRAPVITYVVRWTADGRNETGLNGRQLQKLEGKRRRNVQRLDYRYAALSLAGIARERT